MQTLTRNGYTSSEVIKALHADVREFHFKYELLDSQNRLKKKLTTVLSGTVENNALAEIKRTAKFVLQDDGTINFLSDRIKPYCLVKMPDGGFAEFPLGVFILSTPPKKVDNTGNVIRDIQAYDLLQILIDDKVTDRFTITAGTNYISAVNTLLSSAGFTVVNLTSTSKTLPVTKEYEPGTTKLKIINDLLNVINYNSLIIDEDGIPVAKPYTSPSDRASEYTYKNDDKSVIFPDVVGSLDLFNVPNKWVLVTSEPDRPPLTSTYINTNPNSPTSTVNRGRTIVRYEQAEGADQTTLDAKVQRLAFEASQVYEQVEFQTAIMPMHSDSDVFTLEFSDLDISSKYSETYWSFDLVHNAKMKHRIRRVVEV